MKKKTIILGLTVLSFLSINFNFSPKVYALTASVSDSDINNDGIIDIKDIAIVSSNYNSKISDNNYQGNYDINEDKIIDLYDMTLISKTIGKTVSIKGYVHNPEVQFDLKVRSAPNLRSNTLGYLYNYEKINILAVKTDASGNLWDQIIFNNKTAYVSDAYIQHYTSPPGNTTNIAVKITKQFEVGTANQIAGNFDGQGLSLGYLQWCIGLGNLQPLLNRMDRQYNSEMKNIFGKNYTDIHNMLLNDSQNQLKWAKSINDSSNKIIAPWYSQFVSLSKNKHFISIEKDAEVYTVKQSMLICNKYNLKTVRGFALAFDIATQNGGITSDAAKIINSALKKNPNISEKDLLKVIANAVADTADINKEDIRSRKMAIVNGKGNVHKTMFYLDRDYGLNNNLWR